jgi:type IV pilus assembly protein PilO
MAAPQKPQGSTLDRLGALGKILLTLFFLGLVVGAYFMIFYADLDGQINQEVQKVSKMETELRKSEEARGAYQKDSDEKTKCELAEGESKKVLPDDPETPALLLALQGVATVAGVKLTAWTPQEEFPLEFYTKVPMKLTVTGRFHQLARFFHGVGQLDRVTNMENIVIKSLAKSKEDENSDLSVECLATAFRANAAVAAAAAAPGAAPAPAPKPAAPGGH